MSTKIRIRRSVDIQSQLSFCYLSTWVITLITVYMFVYVLTYAERRIFQGLLSYFSL